MSALRIGVLALQGNFREHIATLRRLGAAAIEVRKPEQLAGLDGLVVPGGESTAIGRLARLYGLVEPIRERAASGMPMLGTCAGMIVMASRVIGGEPLLSLVDVAIRRNAYGRQVDSFETDVAVEGLGEVRGVFIRAPWVEDVGADVRVLAEHEGRPVVLEQGNLVVAAFHPELAGDPRLHEYVIGKAS